MCTFLITREEPNNNSTGLNTAICALLMTSADWCKSGVLPLGNPCSIRWTTGTEKSRKN